ncbi:MAG: aminopeptidase [Steroidobacteraceae bacterium]
MNSSSIALRIRAPCAVVLICVSVGGCYLVESAQGQLNLMAKREPIPRVVADPATPPAVRTQLEAVAQIRKFAVADLSLPDNGSYRSYADVGRPYVVWNVVAAPEFSVEAKEWCYPIVGCVAYRGYFALRRARSFAGKLRRRGFDVSVDGVAAYSTLGHFNDPVLNTMLGWSDVELAAIIFHELTHQMLYVPDDADFNEAFATTVEEEGVRRWLKAQGRERDLAEFALQQRHYQEVVALMIRTRTDLRALYASGIEPALMRDRKRTAYTALHDSYAQLKVEWGGHAPFESWFEEAQLNNANLASVATYFDCVPGFEHELDSAGANLEAFYRRVRELAKLNQARRDALLCGQRYQARIAPPAGDAGS